MIVTYRFTVRPPSIGTHPDGAVAIRALNPSQQWNHGEVDYLEPLDMSVAAHFDLVPVRDGKAGLELWPHLRWEDTDYEWRQLFGRAGGEEIMYAYGTGAADRAAVEAVVKDWAADYDATIDVVWPD